MPTPITLDLYADIACPWCWIGDSRLNVALDRRPELRVERHWRPFLLQPDLPKGGVPWKDFIGPKFGGEARATEMFAHVAGVGAQDGLEFRFDRVAKANDTRDAHRLVLFARAHGREFATADALFQAYFRDGVDLEDREALVQVAEACGLPATHARDWLASQEGTAAVETSRAEAARLGIRGVPFFVFNGEIGVSGAQPVDVLVAALDEAAG
jgi:predicted DsbA family dithiol-disulfide isomerase